MKPNAWTNVNKLNLMVKCCPP